MAKADLKRLDFGKEFKDDTRYTTIHEEVKLSNAKAKKILVVAKEQEKTKSKTHYWHVSEDGKTRTLKKINNQ